MKPEHPPEHIPERTPLTNAEKTVFGEHAVHDADGEIIEEGIGSPLHNAKDAIRANTATPQQHAFVEDHAARRHRAKHGIPEPVGAQKPLSFDPNGPPARLTKHEPIKPEPKSAPMKFEPMKLEQTRRDPLKSENEKSPYEASPYGD